MIVEASEENARTPNGHHSFRESQKNEPHPRWSMTRGRDVNAVKSPIAINVCLAGTTMEGPRNDRLHRDGQWRDSRATPWSAMMGNPWSAMELPRCTDACGGTTRRPPESKKLLGTLDNEKESLSETVCILSSDVARAKVGGTVMPFCEGCSGAVSLFLTTETFKRAVETL